MSQRSSSSRRSPTPTVAPSPLEKAQSWRLSIDLVDDPDFVLPYASKQAALDEAEAIIRRGYAIRDMREDKSNRYEIRLHPLHRIRYLSLYSAE